MWSPLSGIATTPKQSVKPEVLATIIRDVKQMWALSSRWTGNGRKGIMARLLFLGDIVGRSGRSAVIRHLPALREE